MIDERISSFAERLAIALTMRNMKQSELCAKTKIPKSAVSQYLSGAFEPKNDRLCLIANALHCSEMWLLGFDVPMERYANVDPDDAEFLDALPPLLPKEQLPPELEAINVLLYPYGRSIMKVKDTYFLDDCGELTQDEVNDLLNAVMIAIKNATDLLSAKKNRELKDLFNKKPSNTSNTSNK